MTSVEINAVVELLKKGDVDWTLRMKIANLLSDDSIYRIVPADEAEFECPCCGETQLIHKSTHLCNDCAIDVIDF